MIKWDGITPTPDHMLLGRTICAVARHEQPPMYPPCGACLDYAEVILTKIQGGPAVEPVGHKWMLEVVPGYCEACGVSWLNLDADANCKGPRRGTWHHLHPDD